MTLSKIKVLSAAALIAVAGAVQAAVSQHRHVTIEYEYVKDGEIVSRKINGAVQRYEYDLRGQLTGVYDGDGKAVESYAYDAAGNILKITVNGKTTSFTYDGANQLVSKEDASGTTTYAYDAAGRMVREGGKEYRYSYLDKITSVVENGETAATMDYFVGGQIASVTRGGDAEKFIWDGLALVHRDGSDYLNEPAVGGGNPIVSNGGVLFNDLLGSTVAVKGDDGYSLTSMTAFGDNGNPDAFFTGKPFVGELGYAFLMRNYRPENGKWQTADPIGYPDGWNNLAYCNNGVTSAADWLGAITIFISGAGESLFDPMSSSLNSIVCPHCGKTLWESDAEFSFYSWDEKSTIMDILAAVPDGEPITLVGHSYGGDTAYLVARDCEQEVTLITLDPVSWFTFGIEGNRPIGVWINIIADLEATPDTLLALLGGKWGYTLGALNMWADGIGHADVYGMLMFLKSNHPDVWDSVHNCLE